MARHIAAAGVLVIISLGGGAVGYHVFEDLGWLDATYNAAMILTGMGPACVVHSDAGKVFVTCYALFSGLVFLTSGAVVVAPILHRLMHRFHLQQSRSDEPG